MKVFTDFERDTVGSDPTGFSETNGSVTSPVKIGARIGANAIMVKRRYLAFESATAGSNGRPISYDAAGSPSDFDIVVGVCLPLCTVEQVQIMGRQSGGVDSYRCTVNIAGNQLIIQKRVSGVITALATASVTWDTTKNYFVRFQGRSTALKAKAWLASLGKAGQPSAWDASVTDGTITAAGTVTISGTHSTLASKVAAFNFVSVGTGTDDAQVPITNAEYSAWLAGVNERRVLAEMAVTGYDGISAKTTWRMYIANGGFTSQEWDYPASRHYEAWIASIPTFTRQMGVALAGEVRVGYGDLVVALSRTGESNSVGERDNWVRMRWQRDYVKLFLGDPDWPRHDFRPILVGRTTQPVADSTRTVRFPLRDLTQAFDVPVTTDRLTDDRLTPRLFGRVALLEPPLTNVATNEFTIDDGPITEQPAPVPAWQNGVKLVTVAGLTVAAVNTGTETLTASANHGLATDWRVRFDSGTPPAGLSLATDYYVIAAGLTATDFRLSTTVGGAAVNLTSGTTGAGFTGYANRFDLANGKMYVAGNIADSRIMVGHHDPTPGTNDDYGIEDDAGISNEYLLANLYDQLIFDAAAVSRDWQDTDSFDALKVASNMTDKVGIWAGTDPRQVRDVLARVAEETLSWFGQAPDGLIQVGAIGLPAATASMTFTESNVQESSLRLLSNRPPADFDTFTVQYRPRFFESVPIQTVDPGFNKEYINGALLVVTSSPPLDGDYSFDRAEGGAIKTLFLESSGMAARIQALYKYALAVFQFKTTLRAIECGIGDTISLTHSRFEWKSWNGSSDKTSPDAVGVAWDGRLAVVIGTEVNLDDTSGFPVTLTVMRALPGYYPTQDLTY